LAEEKLADKAIITESYGEDYKKNLQLHLDGLTEGNLN
jgi:hypothetical protein